MEGGREQPEFDDAFLARLRRREERAFNELVLRFEGQVHRLVWRMLQNEAESEDMTQEVFVQVFRSLDAFRGDSKLSTWIYRIAVNLTKNRNKYLGRRHQKSHHDIDDVEPSVAHNRAQGFTSGEVSRPDQAVQGQETERVVRECLAELDEDFREILVLRDVEGLSYDEVGSITELGEGTVKSRLHRARAELRRLVEARLGEKLP
jgi:RNA polymerase sigma-70 factor (ECF subfamily)